MQLTSDLLIPLSSLALGFSAALGMAWVLPVWDRFTRWRFEQLIPEWTDLGFDPERLLRYHRWWGLAMLGAVLAGILVGSPGIGLAVAGLIYFVPTYTVRGQLRRRRSLLRDQMVSACLGLANAARAGLSLPQGLEVISTETEEPLAAELRRMVSEYQRGRPLPDTLRDAQARLRLESFNLFAAAILVCMDRGGRITDALDRIGASLRENQRLRRKLEADTASGNKVVLILGLFPFLFLGGFYLMDPEMTSMVFKTLWGQVILLLAIGIDVLSIVWARRILKVDAVGS